MENNTETPEQQGWINPDGTFGTLEGAPDTVRDVVNKKGFKSAEDIAKSYVEMEKTWGASKQTIDELKGKLPQVPESADQYDFKYEGNLPLDEELMGSFKNYAHDLGLSNEQFGKIVQFQVDSVQKAMEAQEASDAQAKLDTLSQIKESKGEKWEEYLANSAKAAEGLGLNDILEKKGLSNDMEMLDVLNSLYAQMNEDTIKTSQEGGMSKQDELKSLMASESFKNGMHPEHAKAMQRFQELHRT